MMNKLKILLFAFVIFPNTVLSQLNTDSLLTEIKSFTIILSDTINESTLINTYVSPDSLEQYVICQNLKGEIVNVSMISFAIHCKSVDHLGRETLEAYYDGDGVLKSIPSIGQVFRETIYFDSISMKQTNYRRGDRSLEFRTERYFDEQQREIERREYDDALDLTYRSKCQFDDVNHTRTEKLFDSESNLIVNDCGAAIEVIKYPISGFTENSNDWLEQRMYTSDMKLVDCYNSYGFDSSYAILRRIPESDNKIRIVLLNAKNEVLFDEVIQN